MPQEVPRIEMNFNCMKLNPYQTSMMIHPTPNRYVNVFKKNWKKAIVTALLAFSPNQARKSAGYAVPITETETFRLWATRKPQPQHLMPFSRYSLAQLITIPYELSAHMPAHYYKIIIIIMFSTYGSWAIPRIVVVCRSETM